MSSFKTRNVNVGFELLQEAAEEFSGFVMGMTDGNVYASVTSAVNADAKKELEANKQKRILRRGFAKILDRTTAGLTLKDIDATAKTAWSNSGQSVDDVESVITIVFAGSTLRQSKSLTHATTTQYTEFAKNPVKHTVKMIDPRKIDRQKIETQKQDPESGSEEEIDDEEKYQVTVTGGQLPADTVNQNLNIEVDGENLNRFSTPSFGTITIKRPELGFAARQASHFPVFLSAITPLEMSRCTPHINVTVITPRNSSLGRGQRNRMSLYQFLGDEPNERELKGPFGGAGGPVPVDLKTQNRDDPSFAENHYGYMDMFTAPQTMVNANINKSGFVDMIKMAAEAGSFSDFGEEPMGHVVRDPFQPFMTIMSFDVSISGVGHGLLATKKAFLKVRLHDKSRIKDIAPLLSPDEFAFTKFIIDFGWNHPEGDVTSTNTIGKYLNALKDSGVYQLVSADYSFGSDNSVDITLNLVCSGFNEMKAISCAGGVDTNLNIFQGTITRLLNKAARNVLGERQPQELTSKVKLQNRSLKSRSAMISFLDEKGDPNLLRLREAITADFVDGGLSIKDSLTEIISLLAQNSGNAAAKSYEDIIENSSITEGLANKAGDTIYAKLYALEKTADPYLTHVGSNFFDSIKEATKSLENKPGDEIRAAIRELPRMVGESSHESIDKSGDPHVSLGKILSNYVGYPMSTCGLYDEVQMIFYPVNGQSASARKHTTASFPISRRRLESEINKRMHTSEVALNNLSVHGFFSLVDRIVSDKTIPAYGIYSDGSISESVSGSELSDFLKKKREEKLKEVDAAESGYDEATAAALSEATDAAAASTKEKKDQEKAVENARLEVYRQFLASKIQEATIKKLEKIYKEDEAVGVKGIYNSSTFTPVSLAMFFETVNVAANETGDAKDFFKSLIGLNRREIVDNGRFSDKTILRIHIYDAYAQMNPDLAIFGTDLDVKGTATDPDEVAFIEKAKELPYGFFKNLLMNKHPTIIHGSASGVVNNITVQSNTSGTLANVLMVEAYDRKTAGGAAGGVKNDFDETILFPTTVALEMMGFPMLNRGAQLFIDFGTGTSLDNLYIVKTVDHSIRDGEFVTKAVLVASNQFVVTSFRDKLIRKAARIIDKTGSESTS